MKCQLGSGWNPSHGSKEAGKGGGRGRVAEMEQAIGEGRGRVIGHHVD